jgi:hypothetical protein
LLSGENEAARRGQIERAGVYRKLADHGSEGAALERLGERPKRVVDVTDAQMDEMRRPDTQLGKARGVGCAAFPSCEIVLDIEDVTARFAGARGQAQGKARGGAEVARSGRHDLMHCLAVEAAAERGIDCSLPKGNGCTRGLPGIAGAASLNGGNRLP